MNKMILWIAAGLLLLSTASAQIDNQQASECYDVESIGLVQYNYFLDLNKLSALFNSSLSYDCVKQLTGLQGYDFYIEITDFRGNYLFSDDLVFIYGIYPGKTELDIIKGQNLSSIEGIDWLNNPAYSYYSASESGATHPGEEVLCRASGFHGLYYNLPGDHPDVEDNVSPREPPSLPEDHDWWDEQYLVFERSDNVLDDTSNFFPVDTGLLNDPHDFAVVWNATVSIPENETYIYNLGSDDDLWVYIDGQLEYDNSGIHAFILKQGASFLTEGEHNLTIYFADRKVVQSGVLFEFQDESVEVFSDMDCEVIEGSLPEEIRENRIELRSSITPEASEYDTLVTFERFVLAKQGFLYVPSKMTLGVWI